jgi:hypothetical protein
LNAIGKFQNIKDKACRDDNYFIFSVSLDTEINCEKVVSEGEYPLRKGVS